MLKCIISPSAFQVQSAVSEELHVTHEQTMKNTLQPVVGIFKRVEGEKKGNMFLREVNNINKIFIKKQTPCKL